MTYEASSANCPSTPSTPSTLANTVATSHSRCSAVSVDTRAHRKSTENAIAASTVSSCTTQNSVWPYADGRK